MNPYKPNAVILRENVIRVSVAVILIICIALVVSFFMRPNIKDYEIEYVSQEEILNFEKERIKSEGDTNLFFGKSADAISYIEELVKQREENGSRVVLLTEGIISGRNVVSISEEVYLAVIQRLASINPIESLNSARSQNLLRKAYNTNDTNNGRYFKRIMRGSSNFKVKQEEADKHITEELEYKYDESGQ